MDRIRKLSVMLDAVSAVEKINLNGLRKEIGRTGKGHTGYSSNLNGRARLHLESLV